MLSAAENNRIKFRVLGGLELACGRPALRTELPQERGHCDPESLKWKDQNLQLSRKLKREKTATLTNFIPKAVTYGLENKAMPALWAHHLGDISCQLLSYCHINSAQKILNSEMFLECRQMERVHRPPCMFAGSVQANFQWRSWISVRVEASFRRTKAKPSPAEGKTEASVKGSRPLLGSLLLAEAGVSCLACTRMQGQEDGI